MWPYFIWKNENSRDKYVMVNKLPEIERPEANIEKVVVPGRDGFLTQDDGTYQSTVKACECELTRGGNIDEISAWLVGTDEITFSNEPDKKYKATIINKIPFSKIVTQVHSFIVIFDCQPRKYSIDNSIITLNAPGMIYNPGSTNAKPILKLYGTGSIDLVVNSNIVHLTNVSSYVMIDSELVDSYKDTVLKNNDMSGEFPELIPGSNAISWTGTVTKIEITPNWMWI